MVGFLWEAEAQDFFTVGFDADDMSIVWMVASHEDGPRGALRASQAARGLQRHSQYFRSKSKGGYRHA